MVEREKEERQEIAIHLDPWIGALLEQDEEMNQAALELRTAITESLKYNPDSPIGKVQARTNTMVCLQEILGEHGDRETRIAQIEQATASFKEGKTGGVGRVRIGRGKDMGVPQLPGITVINFSPKEPRR